MNYTVSATDAVLGVAASHLAVREVPGNHGRFVNYIQRFGGGKDGDPWCAYWVYFVGYHALKDAWPIQRTGSCDVILRDAQRQKLIRTHPTNGGLFLVMNPKNSNDAVHVGFVEYLRPDRGPNAFNTIEGNSNELGEREGVGVFRNVRGYLADERHPDPDRRLYTFVDWAAALELPIHTDPE